MLRLSAGLLSLPLLCLQAQVNVLTFHNDSARTGQNLNETILSPGNVNTNTFRKLFTTQVDGCVYAQPLYVSGLNLPGHGVHNVVFIGTEHNSVYAFDADSNLGPAEGLLWHVNLGPPASVPNNDFGNRYGPFSDITPEVGITGTPVIDLSAGTLYVDAFTHDNGSYHHRVHALNITNGAERGFSPVVVSASVPGQGYDNVNGLVSFDAMQQLQRSALTLAGGVLYVPYASYSDTDPYHGWVIGYQASSLKPLTNYVFNDTPNSTTGAFGSNAGEGGIWMAGCGLASDSATNLFLSTGNGAFDGTGGSAGTEFGNSVLRLSTADGLSAADFFTPFNQASLANSDGDLGSGGVVLLPDEVGSVAHPHLLVTCGKEGKIYLLDRDNLGGYHSLSDSGIVEEIPNANNGTWCTAAYFNNQVYFQASGDVGSTDFLKAFQFSNGALNWTPVSQSSISFGFPGATPAISANGTNNGVVWTIQADGYSTGAPATLHACYASDVSVELYNSDQAGSRDRCGTAVKFSVPTIANGKVYVGGGQSFSVFGLATNASSRRLVQISGLGTVTPNYDTSRLVAGRRYSIAAIPHTGYVFNGWSGSIPSSSRVLTFTMQEGLKLVANFVPNPFGPVAGSYQGLFADPNGVSLQSSGLLNATVAKSGSFSARLQQGANRYTVSGTFLGSGFYSNSLSRHGQAPVSVQLQLALDGENSLTGSIGNDAWTAQLSAFRGAYSKTNLPAQANRRFTLVLSGGADPVAGPVGDGFGSARVDGLGRISFSGMLSDGTRFTESALLSPQAQWALYAAPYGGKGELIGWLTFTNSVAHDLEGQVMWAKPARASTRFYPAGFTNTMNAFGSAFQFTNNSPVLSLAPGQVSFTGGNLPASFTNQINLGSNNKIAGPGKFSLSVNAATGIFKGAAFSAASTRPIPYSGVVIQKMNSGSGFFLGTNQSGRVYLGPN